MIALCVDDEALLLEALVWAVEQSPDITKAVGFGDEEKALAWARENMPDVVFLDVELRRRTGLAVAESLRKNDPLLPVVFCTGHPEYALGAMKMHADGYILKPVDPEEVQQELDRLKLEGRLGRFLLSVRCRGGFAAWDRKGAPLTFRRGRTAEVLAMLIHFRGTPLNVDEMCARLWGDNEAMLENNRNYLRQLLSDLRVGLQAAGAEQVLRHGPGGYSADLSLIREEDRALVDRPYLPAFPWAAEEPQDR